MDTRLKLAAFGVGLLAVFGAAVGVGSAVGPIGPVGPAPAEVSPTEHAPAPSDGAPVPSHEEHTP
ncbi:hypothetical protein JKP75_12250 [Blastococcus sp. TML/M2B]|uniref:hypothetical protein n=1 Tax=unclassified Blastococcus TaxID=2619396 RepID=UPI00190D3D35|nr:MULTISPECIES: hypothetical protein [unclassified Blastococcus]MBN1093260.1 hypothetical protein [Blastococcus sp. TML/M2B]MBN1096629.1 hypothetical protein [Blastococcus sp. TML/C7B]